ncbi:DUF1376 domain-containing protein [Frigidibacter sp. MR17.14]|uniref:DUF1376 domain-containing protein n=1 Tax=Frigidibacter sp. MR17.14 TaxID=3126509 RepID=UPI003012EACD
MEGSRDDFELWVYPMRFGDTLSNHDWIPLYINRLLSSRFAAHVCADDRRGDGFTAMLLWSESFKQDPAGTLPDDDVQLAQLARYGTDVAAWRRAREGALYGWMPVEIEDADARRDGPRLGHRMVAEIAFDMFKRKRGRDDARAESSRYQLKTRIRKKLAELHRKKLAENDYLVTQIADYLTRNKSFCTTDNVATALDVLGALPKVVGRIGEAGGS